MVATAAQSDWQKIIMVYFSAIVLSTIQQNISFLDQYKASWVYHIAPLAHPGEILTGSLWSSVAKFLIPMMSLIGLLLVLSGDWKAWTILSWEPSSSLSSNKF